MPTPCRCTVDLRIITARPTADDEKRMSHRLYGHSTPRRTIPSAAGAGMSKKYSVMSAQGRVPILVGGTGLYFKALTTGLAAVPSIPDAVRAEVRSRLAREGPPTLHAELARLDPATAQRITVNDRSRISRALEVVLATGRSLSDWHRESLPPLLDAGSAAKVFITCERKELVRTPKKDLKPCWMKAFWKGAEARRARSRSGATRMKAHGVPWLIRHLAAEQFACEQAIAGAVMDTRRYAKRQLTWFRNQIRIWPWETSKASDFFTKNRAFCIEIALFMLDRRRAYNAAQ